MSDIKVTNGRTGKTESKDLDIAAMMAVARKTLGDFMAEGDVFVDTEDMPVPGGWEKDEKLGEIVKNGSFKIAKKREASGEKPDSGEKPGSGDKPDSVGKPDGDQEPSTDSPGTKNAANAAPIGSTKGDLGPIVLPDAHWAADNVGRTDGMKDGVVVDGDILSQMKVGQVRNLLKKNGIDLNLDGYGIAPAFVDDGKVFKQAATPAMQFTQVNVTGLQMTRYTSISCQYSEHVSRLHRLTTGGGEATVGIPGVFSVGGSHQTTRLTSSGKRVVKEHKSHSHLIPKARVVFRQSKVSLSEEFVEAIEKAVAADDAARALCSVLEDYGQWFASEMVLGGRLDYWTDKKMEETYTEEQDRDRFQFASTARAVIDGVPVEGTADWSIGLDNAEKQAVIRQASSLFHLMVGGNPNALSPEKWIPTLAKYLNWQIAGFDMLVPTLAYLADEDLRSRCIRVLRDYCTRNLQYRQTIKVGAMHAAPFGEDVGDVKRIVKIEVNHGMNVDGLQVTYELTNGQRKEMPWVGGLHGENWHVVGPLEFDEEIASIETWANDLLRRVAFKTTKGRRFPASPNEFYGRGEGGNLVYAEIEAPRACGLVGNSGRVIDSIGLRYRDLAEGRTLPERWRNFLILLEPYLFPKDVPSHIEMTVRGMLMAGRWRTAEGLDTMSGEDKRNTLIVELGGHSNQDGAYFWGLDDAALVQRGAVVVFLLTTGTHDRIWLKAHSCAEHRAAVIQLIHNARDEPLKALEGLSEGELVRWGFAIKTNTAATIA